MNTNTVVVVEAVNIDEAKYLIKATPEFIVPLQTEIKISFTPDGTRIEDYKPREKHFEYIMARSALYPSRLTPDGIYCADEEGRDNALFVLTELHYDISKLKIEKIA